MKKISLLLILLLLTGCTVNYNIEFDGNKIKENIAGTVNNEEIIEQDNSTGENVYRELLYKDQKVFEDLNELYIKNVVSNDNVINYDFNYTYHNKYEKSRIIKECFSNPIFVETEDIYSVKLTGTFSCLFSDKVTVNLVTNNVVSSNNADKVKDNTYTWIIDSENDADISITILKNEHNIEEKSGISTFKIIGLVILIILSAITYLLYKKKNKNKE